VSGPIDPKELTIRPLRREELDLAMRWAADEGWNPGPHDAEVFWRADPEGFLGSFAPDGRLMASGSIVSYEGHYGFMGLFIVRPGHRGRGIGTPLWLHRRDALRARLRPGAAIGMDGVFAMQSWYARGGFRLTHRNLRFEGTAPVGSFRDDTLVPLGELPLDEVLAHDSRHFGCERRAFLTRWLELPGSLALASRVDGRIVGSGCIRPTQDGWKIGPLFADTPDLGETLFRALCDRTAGEPIQLDVPECHPAALALVRRHGWREVFGCARMYHGPPPAIPWERVYGITTFELG